MNSKSLNLPKAKTIFKSPNKNTKKYNFSFSKTRILKHTNSQMKQPAPKAD